MRLYSTVAILFAGAIGGAGLIIACSDDSPGDADAASCQCPAAEPPLAGRLMRMREEVIIPPNAIGIIGPGCPEGAIILGGGCRLVTNNDRQVVLNEAGFAGDNDYMCIWASTSPQSATGVGEVSCLMPAQ